MSTKIKRTRLLITLLAALFLISGTLLAIQLAKGYRPNFDNLSLSGTGLLSASSYPKNAQVFVNDRLTTVTDDTLNLNPGEYQIKIIKTGFHPWVKAISMKPELVSLTDARLFPTIPSITPLTFYQVSHPQVSPDGSKTVYVLTNSPFTVENGVYVLSLANNLLLGNQITQIADMTVYDYTKAQLIWSPDASQILAVFPDNQKIAASHILNPRGMNQARNTTDTTIKLPQLLSAWQSQLASINRNNLDRLPDFVAQIASESAVNVYFSADREKVLYTVTKDINLPDNLVEKITPSLNPTAQVRTLQSGKTYVYDLKEDTNYLITEAIFNPATSQPLAVNGVIPAIIPTPPPPAGRSIKGKATNPKATESETIMAQINFIRGQTDTHSTQNLSWYPTNRHLVITNSNGTSIVEYDGNNLTPLISAQIEGGFAAASPDGSRLIILSNLNQKPEIVNLISLDLK
jgi:hypothetical protein